MKKNLIIGCSALLVAGSMFAAGRASKFVTATDLYSRSTGGTCTRLVTAANVLASPFQTGIAVGSSKIVSTNNSNYTLWDNPFCNTANGAQVAFQP